MFYKVSQVFQSTGSVVKPGISCSYLIFFHRINIEMFGKERYQVEK